MSTATETRADRTSLFGERALAAGLLDRGRLDECLLDQDRYRARKGRAPRIGEILVHRGFLTREGVVLLLREAKTDPEAEPSRTKTTRVRRQRRSPETRPADSSDREPGREATTRVLPRQRAAETRSAGSSDREPGREATTRVLPRQRAAETPSSGRPVRVSERRSLDQTKFETAMTAVIASIESGGSSARLQPNSAGRALAVRKPSTTPTWTVVVLALGVTSVPASWIVHRYLAASGTSGSPGTERAAASPAAPVQSPPALPKAPCAAPRATLGASAPEPLRCAPEGSRALRVAGETGAAAGTAVRIEVSFYGRAIEALAGESIAGARGEIDTSLSTSRGSLPAGVYHVRVGSAGKREPGEFLVRVGSEADEVAERLRTLADLRETATRVEAIVREAERCPGPSGGDARIEALLAAGKYWKSPEPRPAPAACVAAVRMIDAAVAHVELLSRSDGSGGDLLLTDDPAESRRWIADRAARLESLLSSVEAISSLDAAALSIRDAAVQALHRALLDLGRIAADGVGREAFPGHARTVLDAIEATNRRLERLGGAVGCPGLAGLETLLADAADLVRAASEGHAASAEVIEFAARLDRSGANLSAVAREDRP